MWLSGLRLRAEQPATGDVAQARQLLQDFRTEQEALGKDVRDAFWVASAAGPALGGAGGPLPHPFPATSQTAPVGESGNAWRLSRASVLAEAGAGGCVRVFPVPGSPSEPAAFGMRGEALLIQHELEALAGQSAHAGA